MRGSKKVRAEFSLTALAMPGRYLVSMSLLVGLRVSSRSPPMDSTAGPMPRFDRSASMASNSAVLRASRSGLVTVSSAGQHIA